MPRSVFGKKAHRKMIDLSTDRLRKEGYTELVYGATIPGKGSVDILATGKNLPKTVVECIVLPSKKGLERKAKRYADFADRLIVTIPEDAPSPDVKGIEYWNFPVGRPSKLTIYLGDEEERKLAEIKAALKERLPKGRLLREVPGVSIDLSKSQIVKMAIDKMYSVVFPKSSAKKPIEK